MDRPPRIGMVIPPASGPAPLVASISSAESAVYVFGCAATAPGKEILYPVATVILGGLVSSTLLDMIVTPVVFKMFGEKALKKYIKEQDKIDIDD